MNEKVMHIISQFDFKGELTNVEPYGSGHINDTFRLTYKDNENTNYYILQKLNTDIFTRPEELMENVVNVTEFLKKKVIENNGNPSRETLNVICTKEGQSFYKYENEYWRVFVFVSNAECYDEVKCDEDFYESAYAFGKFQSMLSDYPAHTLHETIYNFHNTAVRYERFKEVVKADVKGRVKDVQNEIDFVMNHDYLSHALADMNLPLRVTHNDTKLNNIMIDKDTHKGICVIDLDTVMPGLAANDFGDAIRFGASTGAEDEKDLSKIECDMHLFEVYTKGFIEGCSGNLTKEELLALPYGAMTMTYECGMRFLTDHIEGDVYFKIHRENHNLDRARTQFKLVADMESKLETMMNIVKKYM